MCLGLRTGSILQRKYVQVSSSHHRVFLTEKKKDFYSLSVQFVLLFEEIFLPCDVDFVCNALLTSPCPCMGRCCLIEIKHFPLIRILIVFCRGVTRCVGFKDDLHGVCVCLEAF